MTAKKQAVQNREPLSSKELEALQPSEISKLKLSEEETRLLRVINDRRAIERADRSQRLSIEEKPIVDELQTVGWKVESVWDLVNTPKPYPEALPILLRHLMLPYSDRTKEGIARSLAVQEARAAWPTLVNEFRSAQNGKGPVAPGDTEEFRLGAKDGLACALAATVTDATMPELIEIMKDRSHGSSRVLMVSALRKSKDPRAKEALEVLAFDPDLEKEIGHWQKKKKPSSRH
jgi:hypothetical protein